MAFPTIPTGGRILTTNQTDSSGTRTFPAFSGLTHSAGDLLIAIVVTYQSTTNPQFSSWSNGFTEFTDQGTSTTLGIGAAYKFTSGGETGSLTVTQAATITGDASMILMAIPAAHISTPPEAGTIANGTSAAADPGSFNPAGWGTEDTLWIAVAGSGLTNISGAWTGTGTTAPTNYTDRVDTNATDTSVIGDVEAAVAFRQLNAASEDIGTAGVDTSNARNSALVIAVRPDTRIFVSGGTASEADTGPAATVDKAVAGGTGEEPNTAPAGVVGKAVSGATASSTEVANEGTVDMGEGGGQTINGDTASETSVANAGSVDKTVTGATSLETDSPQAGTVSKTVSGGTGTEADSAEAGTVAKSVSGGTGSEIDSTQAGAVAKSVSGGTGSETNTAPAGTTAKGVSGGTAGELNVANAGSTPGGPIQGDTASEVDTAPAGSPFKIVTGETTTEASLVNAGGVAKVVLGDTAVETDFALAGIGPEPAAGWTYGADDDWTYGPYPGYGYTTGGTAHSYNAGTAWTYSGV